MPLVNWRWKLLLILNNFESLVKFWIETKMMFDSKVFSILEYVFMYMTYKLYLGWVLSVEGSKLECWGKRVLKFEVFFWTVESSLKRRLSKPQANVPSSFWTQFAWANHKRSVSEQQSCFCEEFAWAKRKRTPSEHAKKPLRLGRLSEPCPVQPHLNFRFVYLSVGTKGVSQLRHLSFDDNKVLKIINWIC